MTFSYDKIPRGFIRLLKPAPLHHVTINTSLAFTVEIHPVAFAPPYTAVSYVWGLGAASQIVYLNGKAFPIRQNLWSCLHYLFLHRTNMHLASLWNHIWVDAICINQSDGDEKNEQVRAMDTVFSHAVEVTAWLGLHRLPSWIQWREHAAKTTDDEGWYLDENIFDVAARPYWSRMWIVQELLLAQRIRLYISGVSFDFWDLTDALRHKQAAANTEDLRRLLAYAKARDADHRILRRPLLDLLLEFGDCQCQDPRDKVFAIMSLLGDADKRALGPYFPDYSLTHDAVVIITLSHLRRYYRDDAEHVSEQVLDSLGVSPSRLLRRRLLAATEQFDVYYDLDLSRKMEFMEIHFFERDYEPEGAQTAEGAQTEGSQTEGAQTETTPWKSLPGQIASHVWSAVTCFGLFRARRDPFEQALIDFWEEARRHESLARAPPQLGGRY